MFALTLKAVTIGRLHTMFSRLSLLGMAEPYSAFSTNELAA